ncbi:MAG: kelch repeat-containing protein [bacterium]
MNAIKKAVTGLVIIAAVFCFLFLGCAGDENVAGNSVITGNACIKGKFYYVGGAPASGVNVILRPRNTLADTSKLLSKSLLNKDTLETDSDGRFVIDTIDTGTYVIEADDGNSNMALVDSVVVSSPDSVVNVEDTLRPVGSVRGFIKLAEGGNSDKIIVLAYGLDRFVLPDTTGLFEFKNMAEGNYHILLFSSLDNYENWDSIGIEVNSGEVTDLDTIELPFTGIPTPKGLSAIYDTLNGLVTLTWDSLDYSDLEGYIVYRNDTSSTTPDKISGNRALTDTFYVDTVFTDLLDTNNYVFEYRLKAQNTGAILGNQFSIPVEINVPSPTKVRTLISLSSINTQNDTASINDTVKIILEYSNETRTNDSIFWAVGHPDSVENKKSISSNTGNDTLLCVWTQKGEKRIYVKITDDSGITWADSTSIIVSVWVRKKPMPTKRAFLSSAIVDGKIYVFGGYNKINGNPINVVEAYDPVNDLWNTKTPMLTPRGQFTVSAVGTKIYLIGGYHSDSTPNYLNIVEEYDPSLDSWTTKSPMITKRSGLASCVVDGKIYAFGGHSKDSVGHYSVDLERYNPDLDSWITLSNMPTPRGSFTASVARGKIYIIGGSNTDLSNTFLSLTEEYNPLNDTWYTQKIMPTARENLTSNTIDGKIYAIGGRANNNVFNTVEEYDPITNLWFSKTKMPTKRLFLTSCNYNGKIYVIGGMDDQNNYLNLIEVYTPFGD